MLRLGLRQLGELPEACTRRSQGWSSPINVLNINDVGRFTFEVEVWLGCMCSSSVSAALLAAYAVRRERTVGGLALGLGQRDVMTFPHPLLQIAAARRLTG